VLRPFRQVDVFTTTPYLGNPVAVVLDGKGLTTEDMERFTRWTNLSEATFVLPPSKPNADYRVRIFTSASATEARSTAEYELSFAGHPTLGTCHAWLKASGMPKQGDVIVQECGAGLVPVRRSADGLAFRAPPLLGQTTGRDGSPFCSGAERTSSRSNPVLSTSTWEWSVRTPRARPRPSRCGHSFRRTPYVASQGTVLGRSGRVRIHEADGAIWVGGGTVTCVTGQVEL
jgi:predicted PhzF superfamily epimerase YddE/YHI9